MHDVDVCIPCYEMGGMGGTHLRSLLESIEIQEGVTFRAVVSDQSEDREVEDVCKDFEAFVDYHKFDGPKNPCDNLNYGITKCSAKTIKIMCQDDLLVGINSLDKCARPILDGRVKWTACSCAHTNDGINLYRPITPAYHDQIHFGHNTMSSPSVICVINDQESLPRFDNEILYLFDVDWYKRLHDEYGDFEMIKDICIVNRMHDDSMSNTENADVSEVLPREQKYIKEKYSETV